MKMFIFVLAVVMMLGLAIPANAVDCSGNACNDVTFEFTNGCYKIKNHSDKRVRVVMGPYSFTLQRGQTHTLVGLDGRCTPSYGGSTTANYL
jgi:hypothetical protein